MEAQQSEDAVIQTLCCQWFQNKMQILFYL